MTTPDQVAAAVERLQRAAKRVLGDTSDAAWPLTECDRPPWDDAKDLARAYLDVTEATTTTRPAWEGERAKLLDACKAANKLLAKMALSGSMPSNDEWCEVQSQLWNAIHATTAVSPPPAVEVGR
jgi:hypothetical protein